MSARRPDRILLCCLVRESPGHRLGATRGDTRRQAAYAGWTRDLTGAVAWRSAEHPTQRVCWFPLAVADSLRNMSRPSPRSSATTPRSPCGPVPRPTSWRTSRGKATATSGCPASRDAPGRRARRADQAACRPTACSYRRVPAAGPTVRSPQPPRARPWSPCCGSSPTPPATAVLPPRPNISAAALATTRRCISLMCGNTTSKNRDSDSDVTSSPPPLLRAYQYGVDT